MSSSRPLMDRKAWLVAAATVVAFALIVGSSVFQDQRQATRLDLGKRAAGEFNRNRPTPTEVRSPLHSLGTVVMVSEAQYERADQVLGYLLKNPAIGSWIYAQDPSLRRAARMTLWAFRWRCSPILVCST